MSTVETNTTAAKLELRRATFASRANLDETIKQQRDVLRCVDVAVVAQELAARSATANDASDAAEDGSSLFAVVDESGPLDGLVVATYLSYGAEPDTKGIADLLIDLGALVLAPVIETGAESSGSVPEPRWAWYHGETSLTRRGIPQPTGAVLGPEALALADLVIVPGLAGGRDGSRIGTGGGWYDRALPHGRADALRILLLNEDEVYDTVPSEAHDVAMDAIVTEAGLIVIHRPGSQSTVTK
ncbi:MAG: 5-formyltetrahydrofolate cyclo-ligase [Propionibacteriaceae bacterium]|nr:5-formyltetrahydrofolate cyclo-ligase [Propionibacteriaceae bacterium]